MEKRFIALQEADDGYHSLVSIPYDKDKGWPRNLHTNAGQVFERADKFRHPGCIPFYRLVPGVTARAAGCQ